MWLYSITVRGVVAVVEIAVLASQALRTVLLTGHIVVLM